LEEIEVVRELEGHASVWLLTLVPGGGSKDQKTRSAAARPANFWRKVEEFPEDLFKKLKEEIERRGKKKERLRERLKEEVEKGWEW